jgi:hypothetical protein
MPFTYQDSRAPAAGSIAELMLRRGDIAARQAEQIGAAQAAAAQQSGQAWAGAAQNIGNSVSGSIQQATDPRRKLEALQAQQAQGQVADATALRQGRSAVDSLMAGDQLAPGDTGPRQESYTDANGLFDVPKLNKALAKMGIGHMAPELLKSAESINASITEHQALEQKIGAASTLMLGDMADGALRLSKLGMPVTAAMDFVIQPALATKRTTPEQYKQIRDQIAALPPEQQQAALTTFMDAASKLDKGETLAKDAEHLDRYGRIVASNVVPEPHKGDYTGPDGIRYNADGKPITGAIMKPQGAPKSIESKNVLLDGKPAIVNYDPSSGKHMLPDGTDVSSRVKPIPAASLTIHNQNAQAPNLPAWALDDTRPTGPDANKLDPNVRMTPNGLYQAAMNYIATGQFPPTGRGSDPASVATRAAITSKVGAIAATAGMDEPALRAFYKSNASSLAQQQKMQDSVQGFMATADKNSALLQETLKKIPDIGIPLFNKPLRSFASSVQGDKNMSQFATYLQSVQNEYARIISQPNLAGQLTDSARHEAETLLDPKATVPQIVASIDALQKEGNNRLVSVGEQIQRIQKRMQTPPGASGTTPKSDPLGLFGPK